MLPVIYGEQNGRCSLRMVAEDTENFAPVVSGEELELALADMDQPLVVDAYATWYVTTLAAKERKRAIPAAYSWQDFSVLVLQWSTK
jgi:hypothetical protein